MLIDLTPDVPAPSRQHPEPERRVWHLGPVPIRGYALSIILGIVAAIWIGERRWVARGGRPGEVSDVAVWAVPFGVIGGRIYHVITDNDLYFGDGANPVEALYIWRGGLGVWGAIALGAVGVLIACRRHGIKMLPMSTRWRPASWSPRRSGAGATGSTRSSSASPPTCRGASRSTRSTGRPATRTSPPSTRRSSTSSSGTSRAFAVMIWLDRRFRLGHGRVLALYVMGYTLGRGWIEMLRIDTVELNNVARPAAQRLDLDRAVRRRRDVLRGGPASCRPGREEPVYVEGAARRRRAEAARRGRVRRTGDRGLRSRSATGPARRDRWSA